MDPLARDFDALMDETLGAMLHLPRRPLLLARFGLSALLPARALAEARFRGPRARALFAGLAAHAVLPLERSPSAAFGLVLGAVFGIAAAVLMARFRFVERGLLPWIVMSQTVPLIALAPQLVSWSGKVDIFGWEWPLKLSVCVLAAFLAFFPISVGTLRGLASAPAAATELMQSYAAGWWRTLFKLRFPSAVPSMVPALKLGATLAVVGVVVSEISIGVKGGIGRAVISYSQAATGDPTKVYAAVFGAALMGLVLYGLIVLIDLLLMRNRPQEVEG
jgi:NitT/TauT family transport system permease protein